MANNDMDVIIYKILQYLYRCDKAGKDPMYEDICYDSKLFKIPQKYWNNIMDELIRKKYVKGFKILRTKDGMLVMMLDHAGITLDGVHFLEDNSKMNEVKAFLGKAFEITLEVIISQLI